MSLKTLHEVLVALAVKADGDWNGIYQMVKNKVILPDEEVNALFGKVKSGAITVVDEDYPSAFKETFHQPLVVFYYGDKSLLAGKRILSVVGSRKASDYSLGMTRRVVGEALDADSDLIICSGMANGADAMAMRVAMGKGRKIIGILGSGIDSPYPEASKDIYDYCVEGKGLVISEYPLDIAPDREHFPFRNRLIAALGQVLLVSQCERKSGTSITIRYAIDGGKDILAIPQRYSPDDMVCRLIADGAGVAIEGRDIAERF